MVYDKRQNDTGEYVITLDCPSSDTVYVDDTATGANTGRSWTNAYLHLSDALVEAAMRLEPVSIKVAQGVYLPDRTTDNPVGTGDRNATFQLINGMIVEGGNPVISNCIFLANRAGWTGGGAFCQDSGITFSGCTFVGNAAAHGGGLYHLSAQDAVVQDSLGLVMIDGIQQLGVSTLKLLPN